MGLDDETFAERSGRTRPASPSSRFPPLPKARPLRHLVRLCFGKKDETIDAGVAAMAKAKGDVRMSPAEEAARLLELAGIDCGGRLVSYSPIDGKPIGRVTVGDPDAAADRAAKAFLRWRTVPAPRRGEFVRLAWRERCGRRSRCSPS